MSKTVEQLTKQIEEAVQETYLDMPDLEADEGSVFSDLLVATVLTEEGISDEMAWELCRTQLGYVPHDLRSLRPGVAKLEAKRDADGW